MDINKVYNIQFKYPKILGNNLKNAKLIGMFGSQEAAKYAETINLHKTVKDANPGLPGYEYCTFCLLQLPNGDKKVFPKEFFDTYEQVQSVSIVVEIHDTNTSDIAIIQSRIEELGYKNFKITTP